MTAARVFNKAFSKRSLRRVYLDNVKETGAIGLDRVSPPQLEPKLRVELETIIRKIRNGTYKFTAYKEKLISKGQGAPPRLISIPTARDRIVLRAICNFLGQVFPEAKLELPQGTIFSLQQALSTGNFSEYAKIDIQSFYPSIPHELIFKALRKKIRKPEILTLIADALRTPTVPSSKGSKGASSANTMGVPQGLAISNLLAEIALREIDTICGERPDLWYKRYVDDILILAKADARAPANEVILQLKEIGLTAHPPDTPESKSRIAKLSEPFTFLGYEIQGDKISVRRDSVLKFESSLAGIFTAYRHKLNRSRSLQDKARALEVCRWRLNLRITGCIFNERRLGWVFYFSQMTDTSRLRSVEKTIEKLTARFNLRGKLKAKSLIKTFYEARRRDKASHRYIPNFDTMPPDEQRRILSTLLGPSKLAGRSDRFVARIFKMRISSAVRELEADLSGIS